VLGIPQQQFHQNIVERLAWWKDESTCKALFNQSIKGIIKIQVEKAPTWYSNLKKQLKKLEIDTIEQEKEFEKTKKLIDKDFRKYEKERLNSRPMSASTIVYKDCYIPTSPINISIHKKCWDESPEKVFDKYADKNWVDWEMWTKLRKHKKSKKARTNKNMNSHFSSISSLIDHPTSPFKSV